MEHIAHERVQDYVNAVNSIKSRGFTIKGIVIDGIQKLFKMFPDYKIQMCQFNMVAIVRRKLTKNPQLNAGIDLLALVYELKNLDSEEFTELFKEWKLKWDEFVKERTVNPITGEIYYTHRRLRSAMLSIEHYIPWLFTFEKVDNMPRTNNLLEGTFTDMKNKLAVHAGLSDGRRQKHSPQPCPPTA